MVKANDLWSLFCDELGYKFVTGVAHIGFDPLYKKMSPKKMHYIPAVNSRTAFGMAYGVAINGIKSMVLIDGRDLRLFVIDYMDWFNLLHDPILILAYVPDSSKPKLAKGILTISFDENYKSALKAFDAKITKKCSPGVVWFDGGIKA